MRMARQSPDDGCGIKMNQQYLKYLVGGFNPSEKILVSWDYPSQYMEK